jgi:four helix bundle protein
MARPLLCTTGVTPEELKTRTTDFAIAAVKYCRVLRETPEARGIAAQLSDSATAVAANYRAAGRARSRREFVSRIAVAVEEADETVGWLKVIRGAGLESDRPVDVLFKEAQEILAILAASRRTAERRVRGRTP